MKLRCWLFDHDWEECSHTHGTGERIIVRRYKVCRRCRESDTAGRVLAGQAMARMRAR